MTRLLNCVLTLMYLSANAQSTQEKNAAYLFVYFTGNSKADEAIRFALSIDGYNYRALNHNNAVISSEKISSTGGVRDPHILRGADGKTFYMVVTDMVSANGWNSNRAMVLLKSNDLINWTSSIINIQKKYPGQDSLLRVWAPQTIYDAGKKKYMIYWSMKHGSGPDKIYYSYANADFTDLETKPEQLFFSPTNGSCIDGDIVYKDGLYHLFFKTEGEGAGIKIAVSDKLTEGYKLRDKYVQQTSHPVEGSGVFKLFNENNYILMYDVYTKGKYQFTKTSNFKEFKVVDNEISMDFHPRHGTIITITAPEAERLVQQWGVADDMILSAQSKSIKKLNIDLDSATKKLVLPVKAGTSLKSFDPRFAQLPGVTITPSKPQDFTQGPVKYTVTLPSKSPQSYSVEAKVYHNPVLDGYYADPDIIYSNKDGKYYIYPTSDGFNNWSGTYFKAFSSTDLVNWKDEGVILDLVKDVNWAKRNAWAPCIIEKKINGQYKYFYYFTAQQKIGVAVADDPKGPFKDVGKALIETFPDGIIKGQHIDPDVFTDRDGKSYLYWGNSYMAGAELNNDMVSLKNETITLLTPDSTFREGTHVFWRDNKYYVMWSEDDTRSENYRVRYAFADSPLGKLKKPENNLVIAKDPGLGIYATGHHSTIQIPGKDEWYIVYHRFNVPKGITMGRAAGYNREVCIDKMVFEKNGEIKQVKPTLKGITPLSNRNKGF